MLTGRTFILLITNDIDKKAIIKNDKKTIPKDLKFDFRFKICFVAIIKAAKIQNWVRKIIGTINSGVTAKNLKNELLEIAPSSNEDYFLVPRVVEWQLNTKQSKKLKAWFLKMRFQILRLFKKCISL